MAILIGWSGHDKPVTQTDALLCIRRGGGRTWWTHIEFTRINIRPTILRKEIEDLREARATWRNAAAFVRCFGQAVRFFP